MRDKETGYMSPPEYPCYQDESQLCRLRELLDSKFECIYKVEICVHSRRRKDEDASKEKQSILL